MKKFWKFFRIIIGVAIIAFGCYKLYMGLWGNDEKREQEARDDAVYIGESVSNEDGVEYCVTELYDTSTVGSDFTEVSTDNNYIVFSLQITNNGNEAYDVNGLRFELIDGENEYEICEDVLLSFENYLYMDTLNPGIGKEYTLAYETPFLSSERDCQLKIKDIGFSDRGSVYINLQNPSDQ